jgi:hypothetical protein
MADVVLVHGAWCVARGVVLGPRRRRSGAPWRLICANDEAIRVDAQRQMAERAETVIEWPTDHSPFVTCPAVVAELIARYV